MPVVLEMLVNMVTSSETLLTIRLAGTRVFAKMGPSYSVASRAYKVLSLFSSNFISEHTCLLCFSRQFSDLVVCCLCNSEYSSLWSFICVVFRKFGQFTSTESSYIV